MSQSEHNERFEFAWEIAKQAGHSTLDYFQSDRLQFEKKQDRTPVTVADRQAETLLRQRILDRFPDDAIIGEEFGEQSGNSGYRWILDPIDGTKSFICGVPLYGTMVGVEWEGASLIGAIYFPGLDEGAYAANGQGCWYVKGTAAPQPARVSQRTDLADCIFVTSEAITFQQRGAVEVYRQLEEKAYITRTWGDCYGYLLVATGRADIMVDPILSVWDAAAVQPIIQEAGGAFTDWRGEPRIDGGDAIGTHGSILSEVLEMTRSYPQPSQESL